MKLDYDTLLNNYNPVIYTLKDDKHCTTYIGLIAQEVEQYLPELVHTNANGYKSIAYSKLGIVSLACVKELRKEIDSLKEKILMLEHKLEWCVMFIVLWY